MFTVIKASLLDSWWTEYTLIGVSYLSSSTFRSHSCSLLFPWRQLRINIWTLMIIVFLSFLFFFTVICRLKSAGFTSQNEIRYIWGFYFSEFWFDHVFIYLSKSENENLSQSSNPGGWNKIKLKIQCALFFCHVCPTSCFMSFYRLFLIYPIFPLLNDHSSENWWAHFLQLHFFASHFCKEKKKLKHLYKKRWNI